MTWKVEKQGRNVIQVRVDGSRRNDWEQWFLLSGDRHWDNPKSNHDLQKDHLEEAVKRNAGVIDIGDLFCAMQGKYDKRSSKSDVRPEHQVDSYLDALVGTAADFFEPWTKNMIVLGVGNHEEAIRKRHETHLTERLVGILNDRTGSNICCGGYGGWVRLIAALGNGTRRMLQMKYFHGSGGGGPVTRGVIQTNRMSVFLPDADLVVTGHTHDHWIVPIARERINRKGKVHMDEQTHIRCGTYKDEYGDAYGGWHIERGGPPKPVGAVWLRVFTEGKKRHIRYEITRAQ